MRYDKNNERLLLSVRELVTTARRGISSTLPCDTDEPDNMAYGGTEKGSENEYFSELNYTFTLGEHTFLLSGKVMIKDGAIHIGTYVDTSPKRPRKEVSTQLRGEGYIYAYMLSERDKLRHVTVSYSYVNKATGEEHSVSEMLEEKKLKSFFDKCKTSIFVYAKPERERVTVRSPSMSKIKFPYKRVRDGQSDIAHGVYNAISRGSTLFVSAPTGTGKTVSVLSLP